MKALGTTLAIAFVLTFATGVASAAEICGNGIDDDSDGFADEGCDARNLSICENPMSCKTTGYIAPKTGGFAYELPPDINPTVPFGPSLSFSRTYLSLYSPPATNYRTAMGAHWHHNWQSWLDKSGTSVIVHLTTGRDVKFTFSTTNGGFDYYVPQPGVHFQYLRQATTSPNNWELKTLTGEVYKYSWTSPIGKLIEVDDTLATPNKITIAYFTSGGNSGQINTITDASGHKRLSFAYTSGLVTTVNYQTGSGSTWTTRVALTFTYTSTNPTTVKIAGATIQTNTYTSNFLTSVQDASANHIIDVSYVGTTGQAARVTTGEGGIGYEYNSANAQCTGQTALFFNLADTTSCTDDTSCPINPLNGVHYHCGGKTGTGATGRCYRAARCLTVTSPNEDLVTTVSPFSPCTGACAPTAQYSWDTSTLNLRGVKLADNTWTSFHYDTNGMVTMKAEGDTDDDPTNGGGVDTWTFYSNATFPGRATEVRTVSNLASSFPCDGGTVNTGGCKRTQYVWNSDGLLGSREDDGLTINAGGDLASFAYVTSYSYDKGRLTQADGPLAGSDDVTQYTYWTSSDVFKDGYLNLIKRETGVVNGSPNFVTTTLDGYDYFGNAGTTIDPDLTPTCRTWDANRNYLSQVREAMAGQTDCTMTNAADLVTSFVRDSWLRLTKTTRPLGDCQHKEYDTFGRLTNTKLRDDCIAANAGYTMVQSYDTNGLLTMTELKDASGTVTRRIQGMYLDGGQVDGIINPVSPSYARNFTYYSDGQRDVTTFENGLGKTEQFWDAENREITRARYETPLAHDDWTFHYPNADSNPSRTFETVTDPASKLVRTYKDDLDRKNQNVSPDSATTTYVYDAASRMVTMIENPSVTHTFTYDNIGRKLSEDYGTETCFGTNPIDVQYTYDALPSGLSCPAGATCTNLAGRLAYVKQFLLCGADASSTIYQETFYGYDAAGRLISEEIDDTTSRAVQQNYTWDKNGNLIGVQAPSGATAAYTLGGAGNSDTNLAATLARSVSGSPTNLLTGILWAPFGPMTQYDEAATIGGNAIRGTFVWNLAYRAAQIKFAATGAPRTQIDYVEDEKGRYTQKLYSNVATGVQSEYLTYDWFDRPTCDGTSSGACNPSLLNFKTMATYNTSNDRSSVNHQDTSTGAVIYSPSYVTGTDQISTYGTIQYGWDGRGNRTSDDDTGSSVDGRSYTYDGRRRVRTITLTYPRFSRGCSPCWDGVTITYAYDHRDRVVFRDWHDTTNGAESQTFYYWDLNDRLIETKFVPSVLSPATYTIYDFYWLGKRPVAFWAVDQSGTTARYFTHDDESNRVLEVFSWPTTGDASNVYARNPEVFGWDVIANGTSFFQPLALDGGIYDDGTTAYFSTTVLERPWLILNHGVHYDPMTETFLQRVGSWPNEPYALGNHTAVGRQITAPQFNSLVPTCTQSDSRSVNCLNCVSSEPISVDNAQVGGGGGGGGLTPIECWICLGTYYKSNHLKSSMCREAWAGWMQCDSSECTKYGTASGQLCAFGQPLGGPDTTIIVW